MAPTPTKPIVDPALPEGRRALRLATLCFTLHAFVQSAMSAHLVMLLGGFGFRPAVVVTAASLMGVAQVAARVLEMSLQGRFGAVAVAVPSVTFLPMAFAVVLLLPTAPWVAVTFVVLYGCGNGLLTIVRGALPLAVFGSGGYGELLGRIAGPGFAAAAAAPMLFSALVEAAGAHAGPVLLAILSAAALASIAALVRLVRRHEARVSASSY